MRLSSSATYVGTYVALTAPFGELRPAGPPTAVGGVSRSFSAARSAFLMTLERAGLAPSRNKDRPPGVTTPVGRGGGDGDGVVAELSRHSSYHTPGVDTKRQREGGGRGGGRRPGGSVAVACNEQEMLSRPCHPRTYMAARKRPPSPLRRS